MMSEQNVAGTERTSVRSVCDFLDMFSRELRVVAVQCTILLEREVLGPGICRSWNLPEERSCPLCPDSEYFRISVSKRGG